MRFLGWSGFCLLLLFLFFTLVLLWLLLCILRFLWFLSLFSWLNGLSNWCLGGSWTTSTKHSFHHIRVFFISFGLSSCNLSSRLFFTYVSFWFLSWSCFFNLFDYSWFLFSLSGNWFLMFFIFISNNNHFRRIRSWEIWINLWLSFSSSCVTLTSLLVIDLLKIFIGITIKISNLGSLWSSWLIPFL